MHLTLVPKLDREMNGECMQKLVRQKQNEGVALTCIKILHPSRNKQKSNLINQDFTIQIRYKSLSSITLFLLKKKI